MCQRVNCKSCGKATYRGCGMHVEQVLSGVPASQRCDCGKSKSGSGSTGSTGSTGGGLFARLLGGRKN